MQTPRNLASALGAQELFDGVAAAVQSESGLVELGELPGRRQTHERVNGDFRAGLHAVLQPGTNDYKRVLHLLFGSH